MYLRFVDDIVNETAKERGWEKVKLPISSSSGKPEKIPGMAKVKVEEQILWA